ncbi:MAG: RtcB family protein [Chitinispirillaceae bacterium]|nr:RtcB family protein [Chitinispirillaceae bacterium]
MKKRDLEKAGIPRGEVMDMALKAAVAGLSSGMCKREILTFLRALAKNPLPFKDDELFGSVSRHLARIDEKNTRNPASPKAPYAIWGTGIDPEAVKQLVQACSLPVAVRGALLPDAHVGYGLPIGGVLAVRNAVIPYAVGVDIACRMKMSVLDLGAETLNNDPDLFTSALKNETRFGVGASFKRKRQHPIMDRDWNVSPVTGQNKDLAWSQLGTSGSGNHFVEFGTLTVLRSDTPLAPGVYLALLSHSGSRGTGSKVASYYSKLARQKHNELPREAANLAWLDLTSHEGSEYWAAMELMGAYAAANHHIIHERIAAFCNASVLWDIENHHNFAWKERHDGREVIVHRKGATPAGTGVIGIIPGSMASPGFVVRGKGCAASLESASHGAGRTMSRSAAKKQFRWNEVRELLAAAGVTLLSAGLDEAPMVYKDIHEVMAAQTDLVAVMARFDPKIVKMAPAGERAED